MSLPFSFPFSFVVSSTSLQVGSRADAAVHLVVCKHTHDLHPPPPVLPQQALSPLVGHARVSKPTRERETEPAGHATRMQKPEPGIRSGTRNGKPGSTRNQTGSGNGNSGTLHKSKSYIVFATFFRFVAHNPGCWAQNKLQRKLRFLLFSISGGSRIYRFRFRFGFW